MEEVKTELRNKGIRPGRQTFNYIEIPSVSSERVGVISDIPGVKMVHYNMPKGIYAFTPTNPFKGNDPLAGEVRISDVEVPPKLVGPDMLLPLRFPHHVYGTPVSERYIIIGTARSRGFLRDVPGGNGKGVTVAVLDTGHSVGPFMKRATLMSDCSTDPQPLDSHGHGSWCTNAAVGPYRPGMFGTCHGVAPEAHAIHIKVLNGLFGFGSSADIIKGMEDAWRNGADVISMSLGGSSCQGGCWQSKPKCPECRTVELLADKGVSVVIAAGNSGDATKEEGGEPWTIGCPGCAPSAITVGSYSITDSVTCYFSSRGPSNKENKGHVTAEEQLKPDVLSPGGGRIFKDTKPDEVLYSLEFGWLQGLYTGVKEVAGNMHGTSQATPQLAGMIALYQETARRKLGRKLSVEEIKSIFKEHNGLPFVPQAEKNKVTTMGNKNTCSGYGLAKLSWLYDYLKR